MAYRAFYSHPVENFSTTTGQPTNAVYGFTSMLIKVLTDEAPTHIAVAFDVSRATFRSEIFADYKATRSKTPEDFRGQVSLIHEVLAALKIASLEVDGYEADDVIATLATEATQEGMEVLICTGDRDALQLVNPLVTVLYPHRGVTGMTRFDPAEVQAKYGLSPAQYPDFAALRGDPSDNLPGIPGVGEKTAAKWIREFGSLQSLVDRVDEVPGKAGDALRDHLGSVLQNSQLTKLIRDVPLDLRPQDLRWTSWDREQVHQLFDNLQFRVLRDRLFTDLSADEPSSEGGFEATVDELAPGELGSWLAEHGHGQHPMGISPYGSWGRGTGTIEAIALCTVAGHGTWVRLAELNAEDEKALAEWLADPDADKAIHDLKGPLLAAWAHGLELEGISSDTILAAYVAMPGQRSFDLTDLIVRYLKRDLTPVATETGQLTLDGGADAANAERAEHGVRTAMAITELAGSLGDWLAGRGGTRLLTDMELPLARVLARMEAAGIAIDMDRLSGLQREFADAVNDAAEDAYAVIGQRINLGSPKQLQIVLFDDLGLPRTKRIKTGYTTDAESLTTLLEQTGHPFLEHLMRHRDVTRLRTVIDGLLPMVDDVGRIHTTFQQTVAATGRLSSADPNLQNIPIRTAEGRRIRQTFVVGPGFESLMTADYSQIEMRIMAH
ncbi:MAG: DNA polymerase I, partial [Actinomycetota bacterium]|nr:DNA polymerase I [Actinomycetota bacterium]